MPFQSHIIPLLLLPYFAIVTWADHLNADDLIRANRCQVIPLAGQQVSLRIDGLEKTRWHFGSQYPRPFFFPLQGPSGEPLTRMGHPGAANHDHHRSVWFAHAKIAGHDFWSDNTSCKVRQKEWLAYRDGPDEGIMATSLVWQDPDGRELMTQELVASILPLPNGEHALEVQITFMLSDDQAEQPIELGKTNFGFFAVRVAKTLSVHFGDGTLTNSEGAVGEASIFGKPAKWVDYSGSILVGRGVERSARREGITFFDHPSNPRYPTHWHVREDGWMGASSCFLKPVLLQPTQPLTYRYLLQAHSGDYSASKARHTHTSFAERPGFIVQKSQRPHRHYEVARRRP